MTELRAAVGVAIFVGVAWCLSSHKRRFPVRVVVGGLALQLALAAVVLGWEQGQKLLQGFAAGLVDLLNYAVVPPAETLFGALGTGDPASPVGFAFAFAGTGLVGILFFSTLLAMLYHLRIMPAIVWAFGVVLKRVLGVSGAEAMSSAANVCVGQTEAPLAIRPYLDKLTRSELMAVMTGGFATIAGSVLVIYIGMIGGAAPELKEIGGDFLAASIMSAPAALLIAKVMVPEVDKPETAKPIGFVEAVKGDGRHANLIDAATTGAREGLFLYLNVVAMLLAFTALVLGANWALQGVAFSLGGWEVKAGDATLQSMLGFVLAPAAWAIGVVNWADCQAVGGLLGIKIATNEFVALGDMAGMLTAAPGEGGFQDPRSARLAVYALCGFANFASIGIQIGGISSLAPGRKAELAKLGLRAMVGGAMASWMTAAVAGLFI
ncbi:MAG: nucleoside transporter C-terminal domain-containing protein [Planctomycetota bacterium]